MCGSPGACSTTGFVGSDAAICSGSSIQSRFCGKRGFKSRLAPKVPRNSKQRLAACMRRSVPAARKSHWRLIRAACITPRVRPGLGSRSCHVHRRIRNRTFSVCCHRRRCCHCRFGWSCTATLPVPRTCARSWNFCLKRFQSMAGRKLRPSSSQLPPAAATPPTSSIPHPADPNPDT